MSKLYETKEQIFEKAETILNKSLREVIASESTEIIQGKLGGYGLRRKGYLGDVIEKYFYDINPGNISEPDFTKAGVELKTTPLKKKNNSLVSKERLVFSMINYNTVVSETWEHSTFLKKNGRLLLMFYLWLESQNILDYEFKFIYLLDLLQDISDEDVYQIQKDWEFIVSKIKRGEAHLLSEGDTYYLGACTKAANSRVVRDQPMNHTPAKPRAFSFKQQYINYIVQSKLLGKPVTTDSFFKKDRRIETIEEAVASKFTRFIGRTDKQILDSLKSDLQNSSKNYKRLIVNQILGVKSNKIAELDKANITLRVITLEANGNLKESISFPAFDYKDLVTQVWYDDEEEVMADFHLRLETKKFLFVVFQKQKASEDIILRKTMFWNFPMDDIGEAERVWQKTKDCVSEGRYDELPKIKDSYVAHVRPHGKNAQDRIETPQQTLEMKRCFWLNAKYIQGFIQNYTDKS